MSTFWKRNSIFVLSGSLIVLIIGSFFDYSISQAIFNADSVLGLCIAGYGQLPISLGMVVSAFLLCKVIEHKICLKSVLQFIAIVYLFVMGIFQMWYEPMIYIPNMNIIINTIITLLILCFSLFYLEKYTKNKNKQDLLQIIKFLTFVIFSQLIFINILKPLCARPRMRLLAITPEAHFQNWWQFNDLQKNALMSSLHIASEEFKSFPSGHAGCSAVLISYFVFPLLNQDNKKCHIVFYIGILFSVIVSISRIIVGAHFVSDTVIGFTITFLLTYIGYQIFIRRRIEHA